LYPLSCFIVVFEQRTQSIFCQFLNALFRYSFGVVLWELLTGREPWAGFKPLQIMHMVAQMGKRLLIPDVLPHGESRPSAALASFVVSQGDQMPQAAPWIYQLLFIAAGQNRSSGRRSKP
jgi:hypothetical protein